MKSISELQDFFYEHVYPELLALELKRVKILASLKKSALLLGLLPFVCFLFLQDFFPDKINLLAILVALSVGLFLLIYKHKMADFSIDYKDQIIEKLVQFVAPTLVYEREKSISKYEYDSSFLFPQEIDKYNGDDKIEGNIEGVNIKFSELHTQKKKKMQKGKLIMRLFLRDFFLLQIFISILKQKRLYCQILVKGI